MKFDSITTTPKLKVCSACLNGLAADDYEVEETTDFRRASDALSEIGKEITPMMSPSRNDFSQGNCFWMLLLQHGKIVGGIGARLDHLGQETLGRFWRRQTIRHYGEGERDQVDNISLFIDREVFGSVLYFGDLKLADDHTGKGSHLRYFTMYCQMVGALKWDPDWQYSFIPKKHAEAGAGFNYGFAKSVPGAQEWYAPPGNRKTSEVCVISSRTDMLDMASFFSRFPEELRVVKHQGSSATEGDGG
jgi:hypothetical protein